MSNENRDARRSKGYKPFWEGEEEEEAPSTAPEKPAYDWSGIKNRLVGNKTAAEIATEEAEKLKKKQG